LENRSVLAESIERGVEAEHAAILGDPIAVHVKTQRPLGIRRGKLILPDTLSKDTGY
jgi:hypothetical protein